ncbi:hypothetical protein AJ80_02444 [Polytolypa hystricis UAMH7299]|uniref:Rxt3-domain-containing protein n=1 Tax=Polytolypa hystricis (strain UAMH7299) TaxID=1447883 RepID=A0A2B7YQQ3_POLH7|nr:hypothetical protein AJ80_02444 [Polytolypa hystricis UAMH7299]
MDPQRPHYHIFGRPSTFGGSQESRNQSLPPRLYSSGPLPNGRSQPPPPPPPPYDPLGRREADLHSRAPPARPPHSAPSAPPPGYPSHPYPHDGAIHPKPSRSPGPFGSTHSEPVPSFHTRHTSHGSSVKSDGGPKDRNIHYREGPSSSMSRDMPHPSQPFDQARRRSLGSNGSPPSYAGRLDHHGQPPAPPPPPPSSYNNRQMLPPSSPQHYPPRTASIPPPPSQAPTPYPPRDPPPPSTHRPGSSMSISSMLGSDTDRPPRETPSSSAYGRPPVTSVLPAPQPPPPSGGMSPPPVLSRPPPSELQNFRRSHTPDHSLFSKPQAPRPYRSSSGGTAQGQPQPPTDDTRFGGLSRPYYPEKPPSSLHSPSTTPFGESRYNPDRRLSLSGPILRPSSQPQMEEPAPRASLFSPVTRPAPGFGDASAKGPAPGRIGYTGMEATSQSPRRYSLPRADHRDEPSHREPEHIGITAQDSKQPPPAPFGPNIIDRDGERQLRPSWQPVTRRLSPDPSRLPSNESSSTYGYSALTNYAKSISSQVPPPRSVPGAPMQARHESALSNDSSPAGNISKFQHPQRLNSPTPGSSSTGPSFSTPAEEHQRKGSDDLFQHRSLLNVSAENKRTGRASPLPQAVQGAQAQIVGPAEEAGIKSELGRVFAGIGSGVGVSAAATPGSGPPTPLTSSPFKRDAITARSSGIDPGESPIPGAKPPRASSGIGTGRRGRKPKDDDSKLDGEHGIGRETTSTRGRRARHVHHHHHHTHHHHHHRHKADEDAASQPFSTQPSTAGARQSSIPSDGPVLATALAPHHHHRHHHHHHVPRSATGSAAAFLQGPSGPPAPPREYSTVVNLQPLLRSVAHLPRYHLGSTLYAPRISAPSAKASHESSKFGYSSTPVPLPRFEGKENCTFTIRVPRFRIDASHREEICARRALWGTGVYTDDSDPVAAAIHSGFVRGEWGEDVDVSMLDLEIKEQHQHAPQPKNGTLKASSTSSSATRSPQPQKSTDATKTKANTPPVPPPDKDLHITLLILPSLQRYDSSVMYGLKSRAWGDNHDGMSFKVEKIEWVDEGASKGEERGGEARRKRLRNMMQSGRIFTAAGLPGRRGVELQQRKKGLGGGGIVANGEGVAAKSVEPVS